jgi:hypothetical protein
MPSSRCVVAFFTHLGECRASTANGDDRYKSAAVALRRHASVGSQTVN